MAQRRKKEREILEIYLLNLLLMYRPLFRIAGFFFLIYAVVVLVAYPLGGGVAFTAAVLFLLLSYSYKTTLTMAKFGAWIGTLGRTK